MKIKLIWVYTVVVISGCGGPKPILYPNEHFYAAGQTLVDSDIAACKVKADEFGATPGSGKAEGTARSTAVGAAGGAAIGAAGGAVSGSAGRGSVFGLATGATAGLIRSLFRTPQPNQTHVRFVNRCLRDRGYDVIGWE